jgi:hypothetical protein
MEIFSKENIIFGSIGVGWGRALGYMFLSSGNAQ